MKLVLRYTLEKIGEIKFQKIHSEIFLTELSMIIFQKVAKSDDKNGAIVLVDVNLTS